ncbi:MAG: hypothetical protein KJ600_01625 [Nanoarchaeota archaeon]|nr:hypothetical protein [Nanoarchaeota archaeon]MBU1103239.1 hypothetical protein [Nanoarchaeota archaeon]
MKTKLLKHEAREKIEEFFSRKDFKPEEVRKIKRLAMKFKIELKGKKKLFCKKCLSRLKGKTRVGKSHKTVECGECGYKNRFRTDR